MGDLLHSSHLSNTLLLLCAGPKVGNVGRNRCAPPNAGAHAFVCPVPCHGAKSSHTGAEHPPLSISESSASSMQQNRVAFGFRVGVLGKKCSNATHRNASSFVYAVLQKFKFIRDGAYFFLEYHGTSTTASPRRSRAARGSRNLFRQRCQRGQRCRPCSAVALRLVKALLANFIPTERK